MTKRKRKTLEQRFKSWWKRRPELHAIPTRVSELKLAMYVAYCNGWTARTRTKR